MVYIKKIYATTFRLIIVVICIAVELFTNACSRYGFVYNMDPNDKSIDKTDKGKKPGNNRYAFQDGASRINLLDKTFFYNNIPFFYSKIREGTIQSLGLDEDEMKQLGVQPEKQPGDHAVTLVGAFSIYTSCCSPGTTRGKCAECNITDYKFENDQSFLEDMKIIIRASVDNRFHISSQEAQRALVSRLDYFGYSLLFYAAYNNDDKTAAYLMQLGACPYYYRDKGMAPIEGARKHSNKKMEELLLAPQYPANKALCDICKHTVLHKKYSMETESYTQSMNPLSNSNSSPAVQGMVECVSNSGVYPIGKYVVRSSTQYRSHTKNQQPFFKLPMPKRQKTCSTRVPRIPGGKCSPPVAVLSISSSSSGKSYTPSSGSNPEKVPRVGKFQ